MRQDARHVMLGRIGQMVDRVVIAIEHVIALAVKEGLVQKHRRRGSLRERLGHKCGVAPSLKCLQANDMLRGGNGIGHREGLGVAQRDAVLGGAGGVERILHRNAHLLERKDGVAAQVASRIGLGKVKVAHVVQGLGNLVVLKVVILQFGAHVHDKAGLFGTIEHSTQTFAGVARKRLTIGCADVAEHTRDAVVARTPRKNLERRRIGEGQHVGLFGRGKALDSRAVKTHALFEGDLKVLGADGKALKTTQHVDEPQTHKTDVTLFDGSEHEVDILLLIHGASLHAHSKVAESIR